MVVNPLIAERVIPAVSSSVFVTETSAAFNPLYLESPLEAAFVKIVYEILPSSTKSLTPVTVTVCAEFQFALVKVRLEGETVPSAVFPDVKVIITSAVG